MSAIAFLLATVTVTAQKSYWEYKTVTDGGFNKSSPQVIVDEFGTSHVMWTSSDPERAGVQIFYTSDATGRFTVPIQVSDSSSGTVFDPRTVPPAGNATGADSALINPFVFRMDDSGVAHIAYVANKWNHLYLFYKSNSGESLHRPLEFAMLDSIGEAVRYGMAVDSSGTAHIVWMRQTGATIDVYYWNSRDRAGGSHLIGTMTLPVWIQNGSRVGDPAVECSRGGVLEIAFRADSGTVYHLQKLPGGPATLIHTLPAPVKDIPLSGSKLIDLRLRMAMDTSGSVHILAPFYNATLRPEMIYISNSTGAYTYRSISDLLDTVPQNFDLHTIGSGSIAATWTTHLASRPEDPPVIKFVEMTKATNGQWNPAQSVNLNAVPTLFSPYRRYATSLSGRNGHLSIAGLWGIDSTNVQVGLYVRNDARPNIRYILPDVAAPGMNVVVEMYADARDKRSFGPDGFNADSVEAVLANPVDSGRVVVGPSVVSWEGRLVSVPLFIRPGADTGAVPLQLRVGADRSNAVTFRIVRPQHIGGSQGRLNVSGALGSGGLFGAKRSGRGVLVVDSLILMQGVFTVDTSDTDPATPGNQGFLPLTILSLGPVHIGPNATLSLSAQTTLEPTPTAGPGGGGGGATINLAGGSGFAGGGGASAFLRDGTGEAESFGTGGTRSGWWNGGPSLSGVGGGATYMFASGGGATGHPFGASGGFGRVGKKEPTGKNEGANGAGAGGAAPLSVSDVSWGGGGGGFATPGGDGDEFGTDFSGGEIVGSRQLVPLAGGSGGGAAYSPLNTAHGGGGGGALALISYGDIIVDGKIHSNGSEGGSSRDQTGASGGGGGAGGGILMASVRGTVIGPQGALQALGGLGGAGSAGGNSGGKGGDGRIRIDGRITGRSTGSAAPASQYSGPSIDRGGAFQAYEGTVVTGHGLPNSSIRVYSHPIGGDWAYSRPPTETTVKADSTWSITLGPDAKSGIVHLVAMQRVVSPSRSEFRFEPEWILSPAGMTSIGRPGATLSKDSIDFGCMRFDSCVVREIELANDGEYSDLVIKRTEIVGDSAFGVVGIGSPVYAGTSTTVRLRFCPGDTGVFQAVVKIYTNMAPDSVRTIVVRGCGLTGQLFTEFPDIDLGEICIGDCVDTTVRIRNVGQSAVTITQITTDLTEMTAEVRTVLPMTIAVGDSADISVRLCIRSIDDNGARLYINNIAIDSIYNPVRIVAINAGPDPLLISQLDFGNIEKDSCREQKIVIQNRSQTSELDLRGLTVDSKNFSLIDPPADGTRIPPGGQIELRVVFCADSLGNFAADLRCSFGNTHCAYDTVVKLLGRSDRKRPLLGVIRPASSTLKFPNTLVQIQSRADTIEILNSGDAPTRLFAPAKVSEADARPGDFSISFPYVVYNLAPSSSLTIPVTFVPSDTGIRRLRVALSDENGWTDTVELTGRGIRSGVRLDRTVVDFGDVRVGDSSEQEVVIISNYGTAPDEVVSVLADGDTKQIIQTLSDTLPKPLPPDAADSLKLLYVFRPDAERTFSSHVMVQYAAGVDIMVQGRGVLEHLAGEPRTVDFGCGYSRASVDSLRAFTLRNTGTYPMVIVDLPVIAGSDAFKVIGAILPDTIPPGGSRVYAVRYTAGTSSAVGIIAVHSSAPESFTVTLKGDVCADDRKLTLRPANVDARVGGTVVIPILAKLDIPLPRDVDYTLTLDYAYDLLAPLVKGRPDATDPVVTGTMSRTAAMESTTPGSVTLTGTIDAGSTSDTLVGIPMKVLLGSTYSTPLVVKIAAVDMLGVGISTVPGTFLAIDCDTLGTITYLGDYALRQNVPNPFNPITEIGYEIARTEHVRLNLYNSMGMLVRVLIDEVQERGEHILRLDASTLPTGAYTYELIAGPFRKTRRMVVLE